MTLVRRPGAHFDNNMHRAESNLKMKNLVSQVKVAALLVAGLGLAGSTLAAPAKKMAQPTVAEAERFVQDAEALLKKLDFNSARAEWVGQNFITDDTEMITAQTGEIRLTAAGELALKARRFKGL